jgi:hypothetical protein
MDTVLAPASKTLGAAKPGNQGFAGGGCAQKSVSRVPLM